MQRRTNPWPAFVDLFSALLIATFAGFIMLSGAYEQEVSGYKLREKELARMRDEAGVIIAQVQKALSQDNALGTKIRRCGDDTCIDLDIHFDRNLDGLSRGEELVALERACSIIRNAIDRLPLEQRKDIEFFIEGHTDSQPLKKARDERERFRFNWNLSSQRATSVLHVFQQCGLKPSDYAILAIGYADSDPIKCDDPTEDCDARNRRTTLRLRANTQHIEARLGKSER